MKLLLFMPSLIILLLKKAAFILQANQKTKINREITVTRQPLSILSELPRGLQPPIGNLIYTAFLKSEFNIMACILFISLQSVLTTYVKY